MASHTGAGRAKQMGFANVYVMGEGTAGWAKAGKPMQPI
jgi:rhodanese-related sulfurtransferase